MKPASLLRSIDLCPRRAWYSLRWKPASLTPKQILYEAVEHALQSESDDPGEAAEAKAMDLCVDPGIDSAEEDILALAEHISALANFLTWMLRPQNDPWKRPDSIRLSDGRLWESGAFLSASEDHLRRVVLVDRWDAWSQMSLERSWDVAGESSVYGAGMDCIVIVIGAMRKGRWSNPLTTGYRHPVAKNLRFRRRDGESFGSTWEKVWREKDSATREEWLDALTEDGVLPDVVRVHPVPVKSGAISHLAETKLRLVETETPPDESLTACFSRTNPCPYRSCCPNGGDPSPEMGFVQIMSR